MNREQWALEFLQYAGWPKSAEKITALVAQATKEGSQAKNNPLDTTEPAPTATNYNQVGVKNYATLDAGFGATLATFKNGYYPQLVAILADPGGGSAMAYAANHELTIWGTGNCVPEVEEIKGGDPRGYMTAPVNTATAPTPTPPSPTPTPPPGPTTEEPKMYYTDPTSGKIIATDPDGNLYAEPNIPGLGISTLSQHPEWHAGSDESGGANPCVGITNRVGPDGQWGYAYITKPTGSSGGGFGPYDLYHFQRTGKPF